MHSTFTMTREPTFKSYCVCRGRNEHELSAESPIIVEPCNQTDILLTTTNKLFSFDRVFDQHATQENVYDEVVQPILDQVLEGFNCTIFAYGQTGSGKTYTMEGNLEERHTRDAGIIPRVITNLFDMLEANHSEYSVKVSLLELYNEELRDLLNPTNHQQGRQIKIFEDKLGSGVIVQGIDERFIQNAQEGLNVLRAGIKYRSIGTTKCNDKSSRSHCVFSLISHIRESVPGKEDVFRIAKLNLVDLAGSENINRSGAEFGRAREAGMINQSLLTLGRVINHLVEHSPHIPYRESKLTRLLKDSLGGKTRTCIIATISIAKMNQEEITSTLDYANRAKNIRNRPEANQPTNRNIHIRDLEMKIEQLKSDLQASYEKNGVYMTQKSFDAIKEENQHLKDAVKDRQDRLDKAKHDLTHTEVKWREVTTKIDSVILDCDRKVDMIRIQEQQARTQQADDLLDYFGKFESDLKSIHKEVEIIGKRYDQLYQHHIQDDQCQMESLELDMDRWNHNVQMSMDQQIQQLTDQNRKQRDELEKEKKRHTETWEKLQQMISEVSQSQKESLEATTATLGASLVNDIDLLENVKTDASTVRNKQASYLKERKNKIAFMENQIREDQDHCKKILSKISLMDNLSKSQQLILQTQAQQKDEGLRKRPLAELEIEPIPRKRPQR
ncbi:P-loop containing nucleoside triphosphate hydrolase protein [Absidia repens]|uniref:Kinesin-like protein n=1 Tax=Absidia repens TaxID=90262 RepID=A0A1X2HX20_9FUNG|nr:P-loop containing nucleoside triphosphate hydrolase protein [Absidia repens]